MENILHRVKSIDVKHIIEIEKDSLVAYQLIPDITVTNGRNVETLVTGLHEINSSIIDRILFKNNRFIYRTKELPSFEILYTKDNIKFFLILPSKWSSFIKQRVETVWPRSAIMKQQDYSDAFQPHKTIIYDIELMNNCFMSIDADYRANTPIESMLGASKDMQNNDIALFQIILEPVNNYWKTKADQSWSKYKKGEDIKNEKLIFQILDFLFLNIIEWILKTFDLLLGVKSDNKKNINREKQTSYYTNNKTSYDGFDVRIKIYSYSESIIRREQTAKSIATALRDVNGDNELVVTNKRTMSRNFIRRKPMATFFKKNILSVKEVSQLMQLPNRELQETYNLLDSIDTREIDLPDILKKGNIPIGETTHKGKTEEVYWPNDKNILALPKIIIGPMGSGKDEYTKNFTVNASKKGDGAIVFDYIKNCEMSESIAKHADCIKIDLSKQENLFSLAYPEIQPIGDNWSKLKVANILSRQVEYLINSLSEEPLTSRMSRYLDAASKVVFIHKGAKVYDVIDVLTNWKARNEYIRKAKYSGIFADDDIEIVDLDSLHDRNKEGKIIGTKESKIEGIMDRINILIKDIYLKTMAKTNINCNHNFCKWMDDGKVILIQMPENVFTNKQVKDTIVTYFMSRIWLATLQRKNTDKIVHIITNEIHQVPTAAKLVANIITEPRKFGVDFYFTVHYLRQLKALQSAIQSAGVSYMLLAGTEKDNLFSLQQEISPFTVEEGLKLKRFHSLNIISYGNQYAKFISKLPKPIN